MNVTIRSQVLRHLEQLPPLSIIALPELYQKLCIPKEKEPAVRGALYGVCIGRSTTARINPPKLYGICLELASGKDVVLSLPGLPREALNLDYGEAGEVKRIIRRLEDGYGRSTIKFWVKTTQRRSVEQSGAAMRGAKKRDDKTCLLCQVEGQNEKRPVSACHLVTRKSSFWKVLDEVEKTKGAIFTEEASRLLDRKLRELEVHSDPKFIVTLCKEHDDLLRSTLANGIPKPALKNGQQIPLYGPREEEAPQEVSILKVGAEEA